MQKDKKKHSFTYAENDNGSGMSSPTDVKSARFPSQLEAYHGSSHTEELCYNETVCLWMTINIYIYIYIYIYILRQ